MNLGSPFDILDLAEAIIVVSAGAYLRSPLPLWLPAYGLFAANLVMDRVAIQQASSPAEIMAIWHCFVVLASVTLRNTLVTLSNGLIFACMFALDGAAVAGFVSDQPVSGLGFDFWNAQSTLHHAQFALLVIAIIGARQRVGNRDWSSHN